MQFLDWSASFIRVRGEKRSIYKVFAAATSYTTTPRNLTVIKSYIYRKLIECFLAYEFISHGIGQQSAF